MPKSPILEARSSKKSKPDKKHHKKPKHRDRNDSASRLTPDSRVRSISRPDSIADSGSLCQVGQLIVVVVPATDMLIQASTTAIIFASHRSTAIFSTYRLFIRIANQTPLDRRTPSPPFNLDFSPLLRSSRSPSRQHSSRQRPPSRSPPRSRSPDRYQFAFALATATWTSFQFRARGEASTSAPDSGANATWTSHPSLVKHTGMRMTYSEREFPVRGALVQRTPASRTRTRARLGPRKEKERERERPARRDETEPREHREHRAGQHRPKVASQVVVTGTLGDLMKLRRNEREKDKLADARRRPGRRR